MNMSEQTGGTGRRLTVRTQLLGAFAFIAVLMIGVLATGYWGITSMGASADIIKDEHDHQWHLLQLKSAVASEWQFYTDYSLTGNPDALGEARAVGKDVTTLSSELRSHIAAGDSAEELEEMDAFIAAHKKFAADCEEMSVAYLTEGQDAGDVIMEYVDASGGAMLETLDSMESAVTRDIASAHADAASAKSSAILMSVVFALFAAVMAGGVGIVISGRISNRVQRVSVAADAIARGDLSRSVEIRSNDELGDLARTFQEMKTGLQSMVGDVGRLASAGVAGDLSVRADASKHEGDFKTIVSGMNETMDAIAVPMREVVRVTDAYARGDLSARVAIDAKGEFKELGETLDRFGEDLQAIVAEAGRIAGRAAEGDLTTRVEIDPKGDYRELLNAIVALQGVLSDTVVNAKAVSKKVLGTAEGLAGAAEEMNAGMEQLASASMEVAEGSQKLSELAQIAAHDIESMSAQIEQTSANASKSREKADDAVQISREVQDAANETLEGLAHIQEGVAKTSDTVGEMNIAIEKVGDMGEVITDVADQTNMLGLNAAIEAARAGEAGKGFAVVADAVKNLAEKVKEAAAESAVAVEHIQESGENAISATGTAVDESAKGGELLHTALDGVDRTVVAMGEVSTMVAEIDSGTKSISEVVEKVVAAIDEVASVSEESASASEESSSSVEEQTSAIQELTAEAQGLSDIANELADELNRFKVNDGGSEEYGQ